MTGHDHTHHEAGRAFWRALDTFMFAAAFVLGALFVEWLVREVGARRIVAQARAASAAAVAKVRQQATSADPAANVEGAAE